MAEVAAAVLATGVTLQCVIHRYWYGLQVQGPYEAILPWCSYAAGYLAIGSHVVAASRQEHTRMPRLKRQELFALLLRIK